MREMRSRPTPPSGALRLELTAQAGKGSDRGQVRDRARCFDRFAAASGRLLQSERAARRLSRVGAACSPLPPCACIE